MAKTVLLISRCPPYPLHLGDRLIVYHLARALHARGCTIDLLAYTQNRSDWHQQAEYNQFFREIHLVREPVRPPGEILMRWLLPGRRFPRMALQSFSPEMWSLVESQTRKHRYDLAHLFGGVHVYEFRHALGDLPALIVPYESYTLYLRRAIATHGRFSDRLRLLAARGFERFMFEPYARTVVLAPPDRGELLQLNSRLSIDVIPNGIDLEYFQPDESQVRDPATLLFFGNYEYAPNVDAAQVLASEILPRIQQKLPEARLLLAGNAPPGALRALTSDSIEVLGRVPDLRPLMQRATLFVCPLRTGAGLKNKVLEAMAMRLPVVATPISSDGIDASNGRELLLADLAAMPQTVLSLLQDEGRRSALATAGRALVEERYSWTRIADQYIALYDEISQRRASR